MVKCLDRKTIIISLIQHFEADFLWNFSHPQNPKFRNNPENFHPCMNEKLANFGQHSTLQCINISYCILKGQVMNCGEMTVNDYQIGTKLRIDLL